MHTTDRPKDEKQNQSNHSSPSKHGVLSRVVDRNATRRVRRTPFPPKVLSYIGFLSFLLLPQRRPIGNNEKGEIHAWCRMLMSR